MKFEDKHVYSGIKRAMDNVGFTKNVIVSNEYGYMYLLKFIHFRLWWI